MQVIIHNPQSIIWTVRWPIVYPHSFMESSYMHDDTYPPIPLFEQFVNSHATSNTTLEVTALYRLVYNIQASLYYTLNVRVVLRKYLCNTQHNTWTDCIIFSFVYNIHSMLGLCCVLHKYLRNTQHNPRSDCIIYRLVYIIPSMLRLCCVLLVVCCVLRVA